MATQLQHFSSRRELHQESHFAKDSDSAVQQEEIGLGLNSEVFRRFTIDFRVANTLFRKILRKQDCTPMNANRSREHAARHGRRGSVAVEFALIAPFFLFLLGGIIEFGQAFYIQSALANAARQGARSAVHNRATNQEVTQKAQSDCHKALGISASDITTAITVNGHANGDLDHAIKGDKVSVTVSVRYSKAAVGFFVDSFADSTLSSTCTLERK